MRFIFIDEIQQQQKKPEFFAVAGLVVDSSHYGKLKNGVDTALKEAGWDPKAEFKGRYIFSKSKGDQNVIVDKRIEMVRTIVATTTAKQNARARFYFAYNEKGKSPENSVPSREGYCEM